MTHAYKIMGVLNITPDSFSDGGQYLDVDAAIRHAEQLVQDGADILDVGAESSRPGAERVSAAEEIKRLSGFLKQISNHFDVPVSLDTYKPEVAEFGVSMGVRMINDITGLQGDSRMLSVVAESGASVVVMHMQNTPDMMQDNPIYGDVVEDVKTFLARSVSLANEAGIQDVIVDPGIGFGKTVAHNLELLQRLDEFQELGCSILIGTSRKSFIGAITGDEPQDRLEGTLASNVMAFERGASIFRVHDVQSVKKALDVSEAIRSGEC